MGFPIFGGIARFGADNKADTAGSGANKQQPVELAIRIESPPCVLFGSATDSSGALLNGCLILTFKEQHNLPFEPSQSVHSVPSTFAAVSSHTTVPTNLSHPTLLYSASSQSSLTNVGSSPKNVTILNVSLKLIQRVTYGKPFVHTVPSCTACTTKITKLASWDVLKTPRDIGVGAHTYPFSHILSGHLPSACALGSTSATRIKYELIAKATYRMPNNTEETRIQLIMPIPVTRSVIRGPDRNSLRVFPPTDVTATAVLPNVIYPTSTIPLELTLNGVSSIGRRWRMRRLSWRIDEKVRVTSNACAQHMSRLNALEEEIKQKQVRNLKKATKPIKRTPDMGPQVTVNITSADYSYSNNMMSPAQTPVPVNLEEEAVTEVASDVFIHPSDHALRQQLHEQQERLRRQQLEEERKQESSVYAEEVRTLVSDDVNSGWKSDFTGSGKIELVLEIDCMKLKSGVSNPVHCVSTSRPYKQPKSTINVACDIEDPKLGISVSHLLIVEAIVAEEILQYANGQPLQQAEEGAQAVTRNALATNSSSADQRLAELSPMFASRNVNYQRQISTDGDYPIEDEEGADASLKSSSRIIGIPTGAARVLRMQFRVVMTERSGLGVSWDDEVPPTYQDIKHEKPPSYIDIASSFDEAALRLPSKAATSSSASVSTSAQISNHGLHNDVGISAALLEQLELGGNDVSDVIHDNATSAAEGPSSIRSINVQNLSELLDTTRMAQ